MLLEDAHKGRALAASALSQNRCHRPFWKIRLCLLQKKGRIVNLLSPAFFSGKTCPDRKFPEGENCFLLFEIVQSFQRDFPIAIFSFCRLRTLPFLPPKIGFSREKEAQFFKVLSILLDIRQADSSFMNPCSLSEKNHFICILNPKVSLMIDHKNASALCLHLQKLIPKLSLRLFVQIHQTFIQQNAFTAQKVKAGKSRPLLLSSGKTMQLPIHKGIQPQLFCTGLDSSIHFFRRNADIFHTEAHFLPQGIHTELKGWILKKNGQIFGSLLGIHG